MLRRVLTTLVVIVLLGAGMGTVPVQAGVGTQPWRVSTRCTQHGVLKVRFDHDLNQNGVERISSDFYAFTATGFQTWEWKTQINGVVFQKGASTPAQRSRPRAVGRPGHLQPGHALRLRVEHHVRTNGQEKFAIGVRIVDGDDEQW